MAATTDPMIPNVAGRHAYAPQHGLSLEPRIVFVILVICAGLSSPDVYPAEELDGIALYQKIEPSTVQVIVEADREGGTVISRGSGFILNEHGHVVTNHHVVEDARVIRVRRGSVTSGAVLTWSVAALDLAVVHAELESPQGVELSESPLDSLTRVVAIGFPRDSISVEAAPSAGTAEGSVSNVFDGRWEGYEQKLRVVQHTANLQLGSSGGPLVDLCGRVVGVNTAAPVFRGGNAVAAGYYYASQSTELAGELRGRGIPFASTREACPAARAAGAAQATKTRRDIASLRQEIRDRWLVILLVASAAIALGVAAFLVSSFRRGVVQAANRVHEGASRLLSRRNWSQSIRPPPSVRIRIGRGADMDAVLKSDAVSRFHAELVVGKSRHRLIDQDSLNGTRVNRSGAWHRIEDDFVALDEPLRFGDVETTVAQLLVLAGVAGKLAGEGQSTPNEEPPPGPVRRNPTTGEIIGNEHK